MGGVPWVPGTQRQTGPLPTQPSPQGPKPALSEEPWGGHRGPEELLLRLWPCTRPQHRPGGLHPSRNTRGSQARMGQAAHREEALPLGRGGLQPAVLCLWVLHLLDASS